MAVLLLCISVLSGIVASLNAYQAVTGRRVSKKPNRRDDRTMRRQSAIAAVVLGIAAFWGLAIATGILVLLPPTT